jgi:hypothetical protein
MLWLARQVQLPHLPAASDIESVDMHRREKTIDAD